MKQPFEPKPRHRIKLLGSARLSLGVGKALAEEMGVDARVDGGSWRPQLADYGVSAATGGGRI